MRKAIVSAGTLRNHRRPAKSGSDAARRNVYQRRLSFEPLEDRRLLSIFYVSPTGSDSSGGTINAPWTLWQANQAIEMGTVRGGDTIYMRGGTYKWFDQCSDTEYAPYWFLGNQIHMSQGTNNDYPWGGTSSTNRITIAGYPGEQVVWDSGEQFSWTQDDQYDWHVNISGCNSLNGFTQWRMDVSGTTSPNCTDTCGFDVTEGMTNINTGNPCHGYWSWYDHDGQKCWAIESGSYPSIPTYYIFWDGALADRGQWRPNLALGHGQRLLVFGCGERRLA